MFPSFLNDIADDFGLEVKTVKGVWESSKSENNEFYKAVFSDNDFVLVHMVTDSTYSERIDGLWFSRGDTLTLYSQDKGTKNFILKHLSMNTMAIEDGKDRLVMSRIYHDENNKFLEVLALKRGFWWGAYNTCRIVIFGSYGIGALSLIYLGLAWLVNKIKNRNK